VPGASTLEPTTTFSHASFLSLLFFVSLLAIPSTGNAQRDYDKIVNVLHLLSAAAHEFEPEMEAAIFETLVNAIGPVNDRDLAAEMNVARAYDAFEG